MIDNNITSKASAISYCSYVNSVNNNNDLYFNNKLLEIHKNEISQNYSELIEEVLQILTAKDFYKKINKADKTISNWKSGFRAYGEFLVNNFQFEDEGTIAYEIDDESLLMDYKISYTKQDLFKNFTLRLITQDRLSGEVYFPISFIKKIFYKTNNKAFF
ncbi:hypothetical protein [Bizionia sp. APA-3]|uniref:hypothetical protein n=1 Tax=Bizionia sp. APA-3 TaxID=1861784 RepID=UPI00080494B2|nr:hypothetical protein [Bizionia sp. APA-3]OBX22594.1 hypothetical protein BAA08_08230 [Bizionia sp. APA-3]